MRESITIAGTNYELETKAYTQFAYKERFGKDYFQGLFSMVNSQAILAKLDQLEDGEELQAHHIDVSILSDFDMTFFHRIFWVFAKSANPRVKPFVDFYMEMEEFPVQDIAPVLMNMLNQGM